jgi:hypothetical protein
MNRFAIKSSSSAVDKEVGPHLANILAAFEYSRCCFWHFAGRKRIVGALLVCGCIVVHKDMLNVLTELRDNLESLSSLSQSVIVGEVTL